MADKQDDRSRADHGDRAGSAHDRGSPALLRILVRLCLLVLAVYGVHRLIDWADELSRAGHGAATLWVIAPLIVIYVLLIAIPFVPGIEISLALLMMEGARIAPLIYLATLAGLLLAYAAGEWLPYGRLRRMLGDLRLRRAAALLERLQPLSRTERLDLLRSHLPHRLRPLLIRYRYVLIAALINLPGNSFIGGGGGILFAAGLSRLFRPAPLCLALALAVAPVPLLVWLFDIHLPW